MSTERIRIDLQRDDDDWRAWVVEGADELAGERYPGSGPADVLEQLGQELDLREVARIKRERGI